MGRVTEYNFRNGCIRWQLSTSIKVIYDIFCASSQRFRDINIWNIWPSKVGQCQFLSCRHWPADQAKLSFYMPDRRSYMQLTTTQEVELTNGHTKILMCHYVQVFVIYRPILTKRQQRWTPTSYCHKVIPRRSSRGIEIKYHRWRERYRHRCRQRRKSSCGAGALRWRQYSRDQLDGRDNALWLSQPRLGLLLKVQQKGYC